MNYTRILPRDAFNESKLLKCIGRLTLLIEDKMLGNLHYVYDNKPFNIHQNESSDIYCINIEFFILTKDIMFYTPLNARSNWPMFCIRDEEIITVFDDRGDLTVEFKNILF